MAVEPPGTGGRRRSVLRALGPALLFGALALVPWFASSGGGSYVLSLATRVVILAVAALSLDLLIGFAGLVSFGHAAFLGIGLYAVGILSSFGVEDLLVQAAAATAAAALFGAGTGAIAIRTRGVYFIMITLAFGQMLYFVATALAQFGGDDGMTLSGRSQILGRDLLRQDGALYWAALGTLAGTFLLLQAVVRSRFGRVLAGFRENETRMEAIGFRAFPYRLTAYVMSAAVAALAGCLLANQAGFVSPAGMTWQRSGELIFMAVLGGVGTLWGAILGAVVFLLAEEVLSRWSEHWPIVFGPLLVLSVFFARNGLAGLLAPGGARR